MSNQVTTSLVQAISSHLGRIAVFSIASLLSASPTLAETPLVVYVDRAAPPGGDGTSWMLAYNDLQDAFDRLIGIWGQVAPSPSTIKIAQGIYTPDRGTGQRNQVFGTSWFVGPALVQILGGFAGVRSCDPDERDITGTPTVLSGDLKGDDGPDFSNREDNSFNILSIGSVESEGCSILIEGLTIAGASENTADAAWGFRGTATIVYGVINPELNYREAPAIVFDSCIFRDNRTLTASGAAMQASGNGVLLRACQFVGNRSAHGSGGAIAWYTNYYANLPISIDACIFENNQARMGGACFFSGAIAINASTFANNRAQISGGAILCGSQMEMSNSLLLANEAATSGGAIESIGFSDVGLFRTTVAENRANSAAGIHIPYGWLGVRDTIFWKNQSAIGNPIIDLWPGLNPAFFGSHFGGVLIDGGDSAIRSPEGFPWAGDPLIDADPRFIRERGPTDSPSEWKSWNYRLRFGSPAGASGSIENWDQPYTDLDGRQSGWTRFSPADLGCYFLNTSDCGANLNRDSDQLVDDTDFSEFAVAYDLAISPPGNPQADFNRDGMVDDADFSIFVIAYDELLCP